MLTSEEKNKIELEEKYRNEIAQKLALSSKINYSESAFKILQALAIISGIWATYFAYTQQLDAKKMQEKEQLLQTAKEFRKSFYEKQLQYYTEAVEAAATLATADKESDDYKKAKKEFYKLYWGRLSIVEDKTVEARMMQFNNLLISYEQPNSEVDKEDLKQASLRLAHDASIYTINVWLDSAERKNYNR